ncbi:hypothetical protein ROJ8625_02425 [Roseivivax jejudonensis]|uniref:Tetratricopeptide repeat protein n=1 Tax=Roseivivax jejudonensis TaxID=1529041 RepID=A0A1X6ZES9_9RHOB|nr:hypothetical protein [Roseivivax jejudonensis]SLN49270.1 hypothetical protein ROJ8625_02425 [Roseivivax jejudonensis]
MTAAGAQATHPPPGRRARRLGRVLAALVLWAGAAGAQGADAPERAAPAAGAGAQSVLTPDALRDVAGRAAVSGRPDLARSAAEALLARDPDDVQALLILSRAARDGQDFDTARDAAGRAFRGAGDADTRYAAALAMAQALSSDGARTRAQFWLRRAMQIAPTERQKAQAVADFRYVRSRNPWSTRLSFSVAPSSNVNGGTTSESFDLFLPIGNGYYVPAPDLEPEGASRALSGLEIGTGISTERVIFETRTRRISLDLGLSRRDVVLSDDARDIAPDAENGDFARTTVSAGLTQDWTTPSKRVGASIGARLARDWYGGDLLSQTVSANGTLRVALAPRLLGQAGLSVDHEAGFGTREDADGWRASLGATHVLEGGHRLSLALSHRDRESDAEILDFTEQEAKLSLDLGRPVLGTGLAFGLSASGRAYEEHPYSLDGRNDRRYGAWARASLDELDYYGFVPDLTLSASRTESDIGLYDSEEFGVSVGIRSKF